MMNSDTERRAEWVGEFRRGMCRSAGFYRRRLANENITPLDRAGIINLLSTFEDLLMDMEFEGE